MRIRKLFNPETLKYRLELVVGWMYIPLTGFWFSLKPKGLLSSLSKDQRRKLHQLAAKGEENSGSEESLNEDDGD